MADRAQLLMARPEEPVAPSSRGRTQGVARTIGGAARNITQGVTSGIQMSRYKKFIEQGATSMQQLFAEAQQKYPGITISPPFFDPKNPNAYPTHVFEQVKSYKARIAAANQQKQAGQKWRDLGAQEDAFITPGQANLIATGVETGDADLGRQIYEKGIDALTEANKGLVNVSKTYQTLFKDGQIDTGKAAREGLKAQVTDQSAPASKHISVSVGGKRGSGDSQATAALLSNIRNAASQLATATDRSQADIRTAIANELYGNDPAATAKMFDASQTVLIGVVKNAARELSQIQGRPVEEVLKDFFPDSGAAGSTPQYELVTD